MDNNNMEPKKSGLSAGAITAIAIGIIAAAGGFGYISSTQNTAQKAKDEASATVKKAEDMNMKQSSSSSSTSPSSSSTSSMNMGSSSEMKMEKVGVFTTYSPEALTKTEGHRNVIFFSATWCPTCQATNKDIQANLSKIDSKLHILTADYDTSTELKQKYGVTMQHTFVVVDGNGNLVSKTSGLPTLDAINTFAFKIT